jgi:hypothetical protein
MQVARWKFSDNGGCPRVHPYKMTPSSGEGLKALEHLTDWTTEKQASS